MGYDMASKEFTMSVLDNVIHVYPGEAWHCDGYIVGEKSGLLRLRKAIDAALESENNPGMGVAPAFVNDGEGYNLFVICTDEETDYLSVPYTSEDALMGSGSPKQIPPWELCPDQQCDLADKAWKEWEDEMKNLDQLREVKERFKTQFPFAAVGIGPQSGALEVRVTTQEEADKIPASFEEVQVNTKVVGEIKPRD
jgi:hypothetical protein